MDFAYPAIITWIIGFVSSEVSARAQDALGRKITLLEKEVFRHQVVYVVSTAFGWGLFLVTLFLVVLCVLQNE